jgi:hypothetical protein
MNRFLFLGVLMTGALLAATSALAQDVRPRVFVTDSESWETRGGLTGDEGGFFGAARGGARPQSVEIMKTFGERCPMVTINRYLDAADFVVVLDHEGGKEFFQRDNKVAVFAENGDMIHSGSTRSLGNAVKDACGAIGRTLR